MFYKNTGSVSSLKSIILYRASETLEYNKNVLCNNKKKCIVQLHEHFRFDI